MRHEACHFVSTKYINLLFKMKKLYYVYCCSSARLLEVDTFKGVLSCGPEELQVKTEEMVIQLMFPNSRNKVELYTREQSDCVLWNQIHYPRITGSKCGLILTQKSKTKALLINFLYSKPLDPGRDKEPLA